MKTKHIFIAVIIISVILNFYFINQSRKTTENMKIVTQDYIIENRALKDSISKLITEKNNLYHFDLQANTYAQDYFEELKIQNPEQAIEQAILDANRHKGQHPLIRFGAENEMFLTNKIKILNHKWIICNFSDGTLWGELLLKYHFDENNKVHFTVIDDLLYPKYKKD